MKILEYHCQDPDGQGWDFARVKFGNINLLVGDTATGKTRLLNTILNLGRFVAAKEFKNGRWDIVFEHRGITYRWNCQTHSRVIAMSQKSLYKNNFSNMSTKLWFL